jgi:hypothetical protein
MVNRPGCRNSFGHLVDGLRLRRCGPISLLTGDTRAARGDGADRDPRDHALPLDASGRGDVRAAKRNDPSGGAEAAGDVQSRLCVPIGRNRHVQINRQFRQTASKLKLMLSRSAAPSKINRLFSRSEKYPQKIIFLRPPEFPSQCCYFPFAFTSPEPLFREAGALSDGRRTAMR